MINSSSTNGLSNIGCFQRKNITLIYGKWYYQVSHLIDLMENQLGDCSTINVYEKSIKKSVSVKTFMMITERKSNYFGLGDLNRISRGVETIGENVKEQILILFGQFTLGKEICNELKMLQEKGWVIILYNRRITNNMECLRYLSFPVNRIFEITSYGKHVLLQTIIDLIGVIRNPSYDRVALARKIKLENFDHSCFSERHVVLHIVMHPFFVSLTLFRNALIAVQQFQRQEVHFVIHTQELFFNIEIFMSLIRRYGTKNISISNTEVYYGSVKKVLSLKKYVDSNSKIRNLILMAYVYDFRDEICYMDESKLKDVHFYSPSIYYLPLLQCDNKRSPNIHETVDLFNQEHFMDTINDIVCNKTNGEQKDEL